MEELRKRQEAAEVLINAFAKAGQGGLSCVQRASTAWRPGWRLGSASSGLCWIALMPICGGRGTATAPEPVSQDASWRIEAAMEVEMKIRGLMMDPATNMPIVILKDASGPTVLPIWVGIYEANAIALEIEKVSTPRPMTHDLIKNLLVGLEALVRKVVVSELKDDTFYAVIWLEREGQMISIDSRPSDALALALRVDCPIYVEDEVLKNSKVAGTTADKFQSEELRRWLENLGDEDMGRYKM
jgi:uncharacterized protein